MALEERKQIRYKVFFTPRATFDTYGSEIDVSDRIDVSGVKDVRKSIDAGDYQLGVYTTDDIVIKGYNINGYFNDENDTRSIFPAGRNLAKVRVVFSELDDDGEETTTISFRGLINEEATRIDIVKEEIKFRVLANDSVIRDTKVAQGLVNDGTLFSVAMLNILNQTRITQILNVDASNINPDLDLLVDDGSAFDNLKTRDALDQLLLASNSVMVIDGSDNVIIKSRDEDETKDVFNFFGKSDEQGRENIVDIAGYNSGRHRMFTSVRINNTERSNSAYESEFGSKRFNQDLDFITSGTNEANIADRLVDEFKAPKIELEITARTAEVKDLELLDRCSVNYPLRLALPEGASFLPIVGITELGETTEPLPRQFGSIMIHPRTAFKVIQKQEQPRTFLTKVKLRQIGKAVNDGTFESSGSSILGFAIIGVSVIQGAADPCDTWNPSVLGAAQLGCTEVDA